MATGGGNVQSSKQTLLNSQALYKVTQRNDSNFTDSSSRPLMLEQYVDTTVLPNEPECMRELRLLTEKHER